MENARILSEVLKLSKQSDNPMMTTHRAKTHAVLCNSMVPARRKRGVRYTCCLCRNNFLGKKQLLLHNQKVHSNGVRFICVDHEKPMKFIYRKSFLKHLQEQPPSPGFRIKRYKCEDCCKAFKRKYHLRLHIKNMHPRHR